MTGTFPHSRDTSVSFLDIVSISLGLPYMVMLQTFKRERRYSGYDVATGYGRCFVSGAASLTSQWYDRYCFKEYPQNKTRHLTTPWQRRFTVAMGCHWSNYLYAVCSTLFCNNSMLMIGRNCRVGKVLVVCSGLGHVIEMVARIAGPWAHVKLFFTRLICHFKASQCLA